MVETISPAVCGTRRRTALALLLFAAGSIGVAAAVGLALGSLGSAGARCRVAIALAVAGVLRESGLVRLPRAAVAPPGAGVAGTTRCRCRCGRSATAPASAPASSPTSPSPRSSVVAVAAAASGTPAARAGADAPSAPAGRRRRAAARPSSIGWRRSTARCAASTPSPWRCSRCALVAARGRGAPPGPGSQLDPSVADDGGLALHPARGHRRDGRGLVRPPAARRSRCRVRREPSLRGELPRVPRSRRRDRRPLADDAGHARLAGAWSKPAIEFPYLVAVRSTATRQRMISIDLRTGLQRVLDVLTTGDDLGRPSIDRGQVTWHKTTPTSSRLLIGNVHNGHVRRCGSSRTAARDEPVAAPWGPGLDRAEPRHLARPGAARLRGPPAPADPPAHRHAAPVLDDGDRRGQGILHAMEHEHRSGVSSAASLDDGRRGDPRPPDAEGFQVAEPIAGRP